MRFKRHEEEHILRTIDADEVLQRARKISKRRSKAKKSFVGEPILITRGTLGNRQLIMEVENETVTGTYLRD